MFDHADGTPSLPNLSEPELDVPEPGKLTGTGGADS